jgi:uncharacterized RDD family membrane protein YckC
MHCKHCGFANGDDDHRCLRCGRRLGGVVIAAPPGYIGANALAASMIVNDETGEFPVDQETLFNRPSEAANTAPNVIPFDRAQRQAAGRAAGRPVAQPPSPAQAPPATKARKAAASSQSLRHAQGSLDFIPAPSSRARKLKTDVDAQVFCHQPVATPTHRFVASSIDAAVILIGFGLLSITFQGLGGQFGSGKMFWIGMAGTLVLVSLLYGLIWAIAGTETAGMRLTDLQLITFDGFQLDARSRALRFASTWLSFCSGGLGLLWAMADEENLTWHDHISKTFPTIREIPGTFVKQRD